MAVGDQDAGSASSGLSAIYQTTGSAGKIVHETLLNSGEAEDIVGFWIQGSTVIGPNIGYPYTKDDKGSVGFYKYPAGGKVTTTLKKGFDWPQGAAISE